MRAMIVVLFAGLALGACAVGGGGGQAVPFRPASCFVCEDFAISSSLENCPGEIIESESRHGWACQRSDGTVEMCRKAHASCR